MSRRGAHIGEGKALIRQVLELVAPPHAHLPGRTVNVEPQCRAELRRLFDNAEAGQLKDQLGRCVKVACARLLISFAPTSDARPPHSRRSSTSATP